MKTPGQIQSFFYAFRGLRFVYRQEKNFRIECIFSILVLLSFLVFDFTRIEMIVLILLCGAVLILEIVNTVGEHFLDLMKPRLSYQVKVVKDILAGMVLICVVLSVIVGCIIYIPAFIELIRLFVV